MGLKEEEETYREMKARDLAAAERRDSKKTTAFDEYIELQSRWHKLVKQVGGPKSPGVDQPQTIVALGLLKEQIDAMLQALTPASSNSNKVTTKDIAVLDKLLDGVKPKTKNAKKETK